MWLVERQVLASGVPSSRQKLALEPRADFSFEQHLFTLELAVSGFGFLALLAMAKDLPF